MKLDEIIKTSVNGLGLEYYGLHLNKDGNNTIVCVYIENIGLDECRTVSLNLKPVLNVEANLPDDYILEVSSPGMDRILFTQKHYEKQVGKDISVKLRCKVNNRKNFKGVLKHVDDQKIMLMIDNEEHFMSFIDIEQARLIPSW